MRIFALSMVAAATLVSGCTEGGYGLGNAGNRGYRQYDYNRPDPAYNGYYADRYYRENPRVRERRLSQNDRVYRGQDGRYYCRRNDGTTGLIVGGLGGGLLGNALSSGGNATLGTLLGAVAGGALGQSVDRGNVRCR